MTDSGSKYYIDTTLNRDEHDKWIQLIDLYIEDAEEIEFNILFKSSDYHDFFNEFKDDLISIGKRKDKIYHSGQYIRFKKSLKLVQYIKAKPYSDWKNNFLEDISFLKNGIEFFATISHEYYIIIKLDESERFELNSKGYSFDTELPYPNKK